MHNLELAYGDELSATEREAICRKTFIHLACVVLEFPLLSTLTADNVERFITFHGTENLDEVEQKRKGILVMASHFGNWELMSLAFSLRFRPFMLGGASSGQSLFGSADRWGPHPWRQPDHPEERLGSQYHTPVATG